MYRLMAVYIVTALFLLTGCGARGPKVANSADDIAGAWRSNSDGSKYSTSKSMEPSVGSASLTKSLANSGSRGPNS